MQNIFHYWSTLNNFQHKILCYSGYFSQKKNNTNKDKAA